ncbi:MAG: HAD family hydrolase [Acidimicrobiales bacterium]
MSGSIALVATDLDGTLWGPDGRCHPDTVAAISTLEQRGIEVLIATGRRRRSAGAGLERNGIDAPAVLLNGCHGWDYRHHEQFHVAPFDPAEAHAVIDAAAEHGISPVLYVDGDHPDCFAEEGCSTAPGHLDALAPFVAPTADLHLVVDDHAVLGFAILGRPLDVMEALAQSLNSTAIGTATTSIDHQYGNASLMVQPSGTTKWTGIESFCRHRDLDPGAVLAVGDAGNDMGMLRAATTSVVIESAPATVRAAADHLIPEPDVGGWAQLLDLV